MRKEEKARIIEAIAATFTEYTNVYLTDIATLDAAATTKLRKECADKDIKLMMVKNTLLQKALESFSDSDFTPLFSVLKGNTALMCSHVANAPAKVIANYKKKGVPALKAAYVQESFYIGAENLSALENIKSREELIGDVIMLLQSPAKNVISALSSGGSTIHGVLETLKNK